MITELQIGSLIFEWDEGNRGLSIAKGHDLANAETVAYIEGFDKEDWREFYIKAAGHYPDEA